MDARRLVLAVCVALLIIALVLTAAVAPTKVAMAQDDGPTDDPVEPAPDAVCNPAAVRLAALMGVDCAVTGAYIAQGVGLGEIAQAYALSQAFPALTWAALLARHSGPEGLGWGSIKKAYWLGELVGADPEALLSAHLAGAGWGELLQPYRTGPGKPDWAAGGAPPWAKGKATSDDSELVSPVAPDATGSAVGNGNGHGNALGNGNGALHGGGNGRSNSGKK